MTEHTAGLARLPRLCKGTAVIETAGSLIVEGAPRRYHLRSSSNAHLAALLRLLDGHHDEESIGTRLGLSPEVVHKVLIQLSDCGLLEWVKPETVSSASPSLHIMNYYSRNISISSHHACAEDLAATLATASVLLVGDGPVSTQLSADLGEVGIGIVASISSPEELRAAVRDTDPQQTPILAVASDPAGSPDALEEAVALCGAADVPVLRYASGASGWEIGPVFLAGTTACVTCSRCRDGLSAISRTDAPAFSDYALGQSSTDSFLAGLLGTEILALIGGTQAARKWYELTCIDTQYSMLSYEVAPDADCTACGDGFPVGPHARCIAAFEWLQAERPGCPAWRRPRPSRPRRQAVPAAQPAPRFPTAPRRLLKHDLPSAGHAAISRAEGKRDKRRAVQPLTAASLGYLLSRIAGARGWVSWDGIAESWLPEPAAAPPPGTGPLTDLYVLLRTDLLSLQETVFAYDNAQHAAIAIRSDFISIDELVPGENASVVLVMVGAFRRILREYGDLALRMAHLDMGSVMLNLAMVADKFGWRVSQAASWDDSLAAALSLDRFNEPITAVVGISIPDSSGQRGN